MQVIELAVAVERHDRADPYDGHERAETGDQVIETGAFDTQPGTQVTDRSPRRRQLVRDRSWRTAGGERGVVHDCQRAAGASQPERGLHRRR